MSNVRYYGMVSLIDNVFAGVGNNPNDAYLDAIDNSKYTTNDMYNNGNFVIYEICKQMYFKVLKYGGDVDFKRPLNNKDIITV